MLVRSDGQPVFHFVNVVDDLEMGITHVIRGEDHVSNTAKHIALFRAFGVEPPKYGHIPLILNPEGTKMSKRDRGAALGTYVEEGFLPEAVNNYLCLLGWSASLFYHLFNGIRHLAWDAGKGFELKTARFSGMLVLAATIVATILAWIVGYMIR